MCPEGSMFLNIMYHTPMRRFQLESKFELPVFFRLHRRPIQIVVFVPVGLSSSLRHLWQVFVFVEVSSVTWLGQLTVGVKITDSFNCWMLNIVGGSYVDPFTFFVTVKQFIGIYDPWNIFLIRIMNPDTKVFRQYLVEI